MQNNKSFKTKVLATVLFASLGLSGCSTYPNKFKCGDAKGLGCTMLRDVDVQIDSGQIEEAYKVKKRGGGKCQGNTCPGKSTDGGLLRLAPRDKAPLYDIKEEENITDKENNLNF